MHVGVYFTWFWFDARLWPFIWPHVAGSLGNGFDPPPQYQSVINNGSIPLDTSYDSQLAKYENEMNMRNMHSKYPENSAFSRAVVRL